MVETYSQIKNAHAALPPFTAPIPTSLLPYLAFFTLVAAFLLAFVFSTLHKSTIPFAELTTSIGASVLVGVGIVALFCSVGVYV